MREQGQDMFSLIASLEEPAEAEEFRLGIRAEDFKAYGAWVIEQVKAAAKAIPPLLRHLPTMKAPRLAGSGAWQWLVPASVCPA